MTSDLSLRKKLIILLNLSLGIDNRTKMLAGLLLYQIKSMRQKSH